MELFETFFSFYLRLLLDFIVCFSTLETSKETALALLYVCVCVWARAREQCIEPKRQRKGD